MKMGFICWWMQSVLWRCYIMIHEREQMRARACLWNEKTTAESLISLEYSEWLPNDDAAHSLQRVSSFNFEIIAAFVLSLKNGVRLSVCATDWTVTFYSSAIALSHQFIRNIESSGYDLTKASFTLPNFVIRSKWLCLLGKNGANDFTSWGCEKSLVNPKICWMSTLAIPSLVAQTIRVLFRIDFLSVFACTIAHWSSKHFQAFWLSRSWAQSISAQ